MRGKQGPSTEREYQEGKHAQQLANIALHIKSMQRSHTSNFIQFKSQTPNKSKQESKKAARGNKFLFKGSISLNRTGYTGVLELQDSLHLAGTCSKFYSKSN